MRRAVWISGVMLAISACGRDPSPLGDSGILTVEVQGGGSVTSDPAGIDCPGRCSKTFALGTHVVLTANPSAGHANIWTGACNDMQTDCGLDMLGATTATARFGFLLSVEPSGDGAGTVDSDIPGISCGDVCVALYSSNETVTLTSTPAPGSLAGGFSGGCTSTTASCGVAMTQARTVTASLLGPGSPLVADQFGNSLDDVGSAIAIDTQGSVYLAGTFNGIIDFGGGPRQSNGMADMFLASLSSSGSHRWSRAIGGASDDEARAVIVDTAGHLTYSGGFKGTGVDFGTLPVLNSNAGSEDAFVAGVSAATGMAVWTLPIATGTVDIGRGLGTANGVVVANGVDGSGQGDIFLRRLNAAAGNVITTPGDFGSTLPDDAGGVAVLRNGDYVTTGSFQLTATFGGGVNVVSNGLRDAYVARYTSAAVAVWIVRIGGSGDDVGRAVAVNSAGEIAITGAQDGDVFVGKFSPDGAEDWLRTFPGSGSDEGRTVALDSAGNVFVAGVISDGADLGTGPLTVNGGQDAFVAKYDPLGNCVWARHFGSAFNVEANGLVLGADDGPIVTGSFEGSTSFGSAGTLVSAGGKDVFLLHMAP